MKQSRIDSKFDPITGLRKPSGNTVSVGITQSDGRGGWVMQTLFVEVYSKEWYKLFPPKAHDYHPGHQEEL